MELRHLRYFIAVAECRNMRQAAERLHVTQPAISRQIQDLETELGFALFHRTVRGLELTPAGQRYLEDAARIFRALDDAAQRARRIAQGASGVIKLGYVENAGWDGILPAIFHRLRTELPEVTLELSTSNTPEQLAAIEAGALDGGFIYRYGDLPDHFAALPLLEHDVVLAVPRAWAIADGADAAVDLLRLAGRPFVLFPRQVYPEYYDTLIGACRQLGFSPRVVHEASTEATILSLVCSGIGAAIVNSANLGRPPAQVRFFKLKNLSIPMPLVFTHRRDADNPILQRLGALLRDVLDEASPGQDASPRAQAQPLTNSRTA